MRSIQNRWGPGSDLPVSHLACGQGGNTRDCCPWWYCLLLSHCRSWVCKILDTLRDPRIPCTYKKSFFIIYAAGANYIRERASTGSSAAIYRYHWNILEGSRDRLTDGSTMGSSDRLDGNWYTMMVLWDDYMVISRESKVQNVAACVTNIEIQLVTIWIHSIRNSLQQSER